MLLPTDAMGEHGSRFWRHTPGEGGTSTSNPKAFRCCFNAGISPTNNANPLTCRTHRWFSA